MQKKTKDTGTVFCLLSTKTKSKVSRQRTVPCLADTSTTDNPQVDLFVAISSPSFSSEDPSALPIYYEVYSAKIKPNDNNLADLSYVATGIVGSISADNGEIAFIPTNNS